VQKHLEDGGDLNMVVNDGGQGLIACATCHKKWFAAFTPEKSVTARRNGPTEFRDGVAGRAVRFPVSDLARVAEEQYPEYFG
jgi:hypothetical protein